MHMFKALFNTILLVKKILRNTQQKHFCQEMFVIFFFLAAEVLHRTFLNKARNSGELLETVKDTLHVMDPKKVFYKEHNLTKI